MTILPNHKSLCCLIAATFLMAIGSLWAASGDNLVSYWTFDGNTTDAGPGANDATGVNSGPNFVAGGFFDQALTLNGTNHLLVPDESEYDFAAAGNGFTVSGWFQVNAFTTNWQALVASGEGSEFRLHRNGGSNNLNLVAGGGGSLTNTSVNVNDGAWHHVVASHNPATSTNSLYVDGIAATRGGITYNSDNNQQLRIGNNPNRLARQFNGQIDDLAIWGRPLTDDEIAVLHNDGLGIQVSTFLQPVWTGLGGDNNWSTDANWTTPPTAGDNVFFQGSTRPSPFNDVAAGTAIGDLTFEPGTAPFTLGNNGVTLNGNLVNNSASTQTVGMPLTLPAGTHDFAANTGDVAVSGVIDGAGGIRKTGASTVTLSGANTYLGTTNIDAGTLQIGGTAFSTTARDYVVADGAVLNIDGNTGYPSGTSSITGAGELRITNGDFSNEGPNFPRGPGRNLNLGLSGTNALIDIQTGAKMLNGGWQNVTWTNNTAALNVDGTFDVWDGRDVRVGALSGSGTIQKGQNNRNNNFIVGLDDGSSDFSGTLNLVRSNDGSNFALVKEGDGTQTLSGSLVAPRVNVNNGVLQLQNGIFGTQARAYTVADGAVLNVDGGSNFAAGISTITGAGEFRISNGDLKTDSGNDRDLTLSLTGANALINIESTGLLRNGGWQNITWTNNTAALNVDGTFDLWDGQQVRVGALSGGGAIIRNSGQGSRDLIVGLDNGDGDFTGSATFTNGSNAPWKLVKEGTGTQTFSGTVGPVDVTVNNGVLQLQNGVFGQEARNYTLANGAVLNVDGGSQYAVGTSTITGDGEFRISNGDLLRSSNNGQLLTLSLNGANSLINIESTGLLRNGGWQNVTWTNNTAALNVDGTFDLWDGQEVRVGALSGSGTVRKGYNGGGAKDFVVGLDNGSAEFTGQLNLQNGGNYYTLVKEGTGTQTISGTADNNSARVEVRDGTLVLAKTSSGSVHANALNATVTGGTLQLGGTGGDQIYYRTDVTVNGGAFDLNGRNEGIDALNGTGGSVRNDGGGTSILTVGQDNGSGDYSGTLTRGSGQLTLVKTGTGTQTISGTTDNNSVRVQVDNGTLVLAKTSSSGVHATAFNATVNGGTLQLGGTGGDQIYFRTDVTVNGGTFDLNGTNEGFQGLIGTGGSVLNNAAGTTSILTVGQNNGSGNYSGTIDDGAGTLALVKTGSGTQTLSGNNSYSGATTVNGGTLLLNGDHSGSGPITVASGATLGGNGSAEFAAVTVAGTVSPGNSPDILGSFASYTFAAGSDYDWELLDTSLGAENGGWDRIDVDGAFTIDNLNAFSIDVTGLYSLHPDELGLAIHKGWESGPFDIVKYGSTNLPNGELTFDVNEGNLGSYGYFTLINDTGAGTLNLLFTATVPEPGTYALLGLMLIGCVVYRRRRSTKAA